MLTWQQLLAENHQQLIVTTELSQCTETQTQVPDVFLRLASSHLHRAPSSSLGMTNRISRSLRTHSSEPAFASGDNRTKLRNPCGRPSSTSQWTVRPRFRSRLANEIESSSIGSRWHVYKEKHNPGVRRSICFYFSRWRS